MGHPQLLDVGAIRSGENRRDLRTGGLRGRRVPGESRAVGHWGGDQRVRERADPHREMDRPARQQCGRIRRADGGAAVCGLAAGSQAACVFGFAGGGAADDGRVYVPESASLFFALDLPEAGSVVEFFYFACAARG